MAEMAVEPCALAALADDQQVQPRVVVAGREERLGQVADAMGLVERADVEQMYVGEDPLAACGELHD